MISVIRMAGIPAIVLAATALAASTPVVATKHPDLASIDAAQVRRVDSDHRYRQAAEIDTLTVDLDATLAALADAQAHAARRDDQIGDLKKTVTELRQKVDALRRKLAQRRTSRTSRTTPAAAPVGDPQAYAAAQLSAEQFGCLRVLWDHESGWRVDATNPTSGAYGIPQALPGDKMATAGADWRTNPATQINWGLGYIRDRYGSPCGAWGFWQTNHWY